MHTKNVAQRQQITLTFHLTDWMKEVGKKAVAGVFASIVFDIIHPISGAIFASTQSMMQELLEPGVKKKLLTDKYNVTSRVYLFVVTFLFSSVVSISMTVSLGFPMNFPAAIWLSIFMIPSTLIIEYLFKNIVSTKKVD